MPFQMDMSGISGLVQSALAMNFIHKSEPTITGRESDWVHDTGQGYFLDHTVWINSETTIIERTTRKNGVSNALKIRIQIYKSVFMYGVHTMDHTVWSKK